MSKTQKQKRALHPESKRKVKDALVIPQSLKIKIGIAFGSLALLRIIAGFFPNERLWGLNHFAFLPLWISILLSVLSVLFCTQVFFRPFQSISNLLFGQKHKVVRLVLPVVVAVTGVVLFWTFRMQTYFLGDGATYIGEMYRLVHGQSVSKDMLYAEQSAPLTGWIYSTIATTINRTPSIKEKFPNDTRITFWVVGPVLGFLYLILSWKASKSFAKEKDEAFSYFLLFLSVAGVLFYFGYVEYYVFVFTALAFYFYSCQRVLEKNQSIVPLIIAFALACASHLMALIALPSLILVLVYRSSPEGMQKYLQLKFILIGIGCILIAGGIFYFASGIYSHGSRNIISMIPFGTKETLQQYTLFSSYHLNDFVNLMWLLAAPIIIGIFFLTRKRISVHPIIIVSSVNVFFFGCLAFFGYASFGLARDWDISAVLGLAFLFFIIPLVQQQDGGTRKYILYAMSGASLAGVIGWCSVNINPNASVDRFKTIMALDVSHIPTDGALNGYEHLRKWYFSQQDPPGNAWAIEKKIECVGYPDDYRALALAVQEVIQSNVQKKYFDFIFDHLFAQIERMKHDSVDSSHAGSRYDFEELVVENMMQCYFLSPDNGLGTDYAQQQLKRMEKVSPHHPLLDIVYGEIEYDRNKSEVSTEQIVHGANAIHTSRLLGVHAGKLLIHAGKYQAAKNVLEASYKIDTTASLPLFYLAVAESQLSNDYAKMENYLVRFLSDPKIRMLQRSMMIDKGMIEYAEKMLGEVRNANRK